MHSTINTAKLHRRELLQVGYSSLLGMGMSGVLAGRSAAAPTATLPRRAKSLILVFQLGGPSHIDTFDPKPSSTAEIRGEFASIPTAATGVRMCEHLPRLAARAGRFALLRSLTGGLPDPMPGIQMLLGGIDELPPGVQGTMTRHDWPCYAAVLDHIRGRRPGVPTGVSLPALYFSMGSYPGQSAGFLGGAHDPWLVGRLPDATSVDLNILSLPVGFGVRQLNDRMELMRHVDRQRAALARSGAASAQQQLAASILASSVVARAFALEREPNRVRDRYGRHSYGQTLLLARRLVQAGVTVVQANMGTNHIWDTHNENFRKLKTELLPPLDQGLSALLDDLADHGMLDETLVVVVGEMGRTPLIGGYLPNHPADGRDHWRFAFSALWAGGGIRGGQAVGSTDRIGAFPVTHVCRPSDLGATIYTALGVDLATEFHDRVGRPVRVSQGTAIEPLFSGSAR